MLSQTARIAIKNEDYEELVGPAESASVDFLEPGTFDCDAPWRLALFNYSRSVLGVPVFHDFLSRVRGGKAPNQHEAQVVRRVLAVWIEHQLGGDGTMNMDEADEDLMIDAGIYDFTEEMVYSEFVKCLWRVRAPDVNGGFLEYATNKAWQSFIGNDPCPVADGIIARMGIKRHPHYRLAVHMICQLAGNYSGNPFPIAQERFAEMAMALIDQSPEIFGRHKINKLIVSRFLDQLRQQDELVLARPAIPHRRAAFYRLRNDT